MMALIPSLDPDTHMYAPYGKAMIKEKVLMHLNHISRNNFN